MSTALDKTEQNDPQIEVVQFVYGHTTLNAPDLIWSSQLHAEVNNFSMKSREMEIFSIINRSKHKALDNWI